MIKYYRQKNFNFQDFDLIVKNNVLYAFYVKKTPHSAKNKDSKKPNTFGLAKSKDGINWEALNDILIPVKNSWEESLWAGCISKQGKIYTVYYTGVVAKERESSCKIGKAYSFDLVKWKKDRKNPVMTFDKNDPYYSNEPNLAFRDPFHFKHNGKNYILLCTKDKIKSKGQRGCIGLFEEYKKNEFRSLPPLFSPGKYYALECPALYKIKNVWYLLYGDDKKTVFCYAIAKNPFGPYKEPKNNVLLPKFNYTLRIIKFKGKYLMYWWIRDFPNGIVRERLAGPRQIETTENGEIKLL